METFMETMVLEKNRVPTALESRRERVERILAACEVRLKAHPEDISTLMEIGRALWEMDQQAKVLEFLSRGLKDHPGHPRLREIIQRYSAERGVVVAAAGRL